MEFLGPAVAIALTFSLIVYGVVSFTSFLIREKRHQREAERVRKQQAEERAEWLAGAVKRRREALERLRETLEQSGPTNSPPMNQMADSSDQGPPVQGKQKPANKSRPEPPTEPAAPLKPTKPLSSEHLEELRSLSTGPIGGTRVITTPTADPPKAHSKKDPVPPGEQPEAGVPKKNPPPRAEQPQRPLHDEHGWHVPSIPGFRRLTPVGSGGMADVFKGEDSTGTLRAVKFLRKSRPGETLEEKLFHREARMLSTLTSKSIPRLISTHLDAPRPYFIMEYIDGTDLGTYVKTNGPITGGSVLLDLAHSTTEALGEIHANNYLHRDIKPSNIMASRRGFKLIDFGIGKDLGSESTSSATRMGTMAFMAPEYMGGKDASRASDIFSWGATLGYAVTGFLPYGPHPEHILMQRVLNGHFDARFLRAVDEIKSRSVTHHMLAYLVGATMRIDPAQRDMSFRDMILALRKLRPTE